MAKEVREKDIRVKGVIRNIIVTATKSNKDDAAKTEGKKRSAMDTPRHRKTRNKRRKNGETMEPIQSSTYEGARPTSTTKQKSSAKDNKRSRGIGAKTASVWRKRTRWRNQLLTFSTKKGRLETINEEFKTKEISIMTNKLTKMELDDGGTTGGKRKTGSEVNEPTAKEDDKAKETPVATGDPENPIGLDEEDNELSREDISKKRRVPAPPTNMILDESKAKGKRKGTKESKLEEVTGDDQLDWDVENDGDVNDLLDELADVSMNALLAKIGEWHTVTTKLTREAENREDVLAVDNLELDLGEEKRTHIQDELERLQEKIHQLKRNIKKASFFYDQNGHYKDKTEAFFEAKHSVKIAPPIHDHICGGQSGGNSPKLCLAVKDCGAKTHKKSRNGLLVGGALYLTMNAGHLVYPLPITRREAASEELIFALTETDMSLYQSIGLRSRLSACSKEEGDRVIKIFLQDNAPHLLASNKPKAVSNNNVEKNDNKEKSNKKGQKTDTNMEEPNEDEDSNMERETTRDENAAKTATIAAVNTGGEQLTLEITNKGKNTVNTSGVKVSRERQVRLNITYHINIPKSTSALDYIREAANNIIGKSLMMIEKEHRAEDGRNLDLVWAPWADGTPMKSILFSNENESTKALKNIGWRGGKELLNGGFFGFRTTKGKEVTKRSCNVRLYFNGSEDDIEKVRQYMSEYMRELDARNQVWKSKLQSSPNPMRVGRIFYSVPTFELAPVIQRIVEVIKDKEKTELEIAINLEAAFETSSDRTTWYEQHDIKTEEDREKLNARKVPTIYCEGKHASMLGLHLSRAFVQDPDPIYLTGSTAQRFIPAPGIMVCFKMRRSFNAFLNETAKLTTLVHSIVNVPGFNLDCFFEPLSPNPGSPFCISPYSILTAMPRSAGDKRSAFFQIGRTRKESTVRAMSIPSLASQAAAYGRKAVHYVAAIMKDMRAEEFLSRIITPEASVEIGQ